MDHKFTIKFTGVLDHASTRKSLEKDISKLEHLIKPKKSSLKSTKDILKHNLSEKKRELAKQNKYEKLRERVEKFRLSETKKLVKQGHTFEKARREAFKKSTMSAQDLRNLEYKKLKEESKQKNKLIKQARKGLRIPGIPSIAIGSAIGNMSSNLISRMIGYGIDALKEKAVKDKMSIISSKIFEGKEKQNLIGKLKGIKSFESEIEKEEFLNKAGVIKSTLKNMGINNKDTLSKAVELAAKMKGSGILSTDQAISSVAELLSGKGDSLFSLMSQFEGFGNKYLEHAKDRYEANITYDPEIATDMLNQVLRDFTSLDLTKNIGPVEKTENEIKKLNEELKKLSTDVLMPTVKYLSQMVNWLNNFKKDIVDPFTQKIKSIFSFEYLFAGLRSILPNFLGGDEGKSLEAYYRKTGSTSDSDHSITSS
ncbi:DUF759 family protein [Borrelia nietonii]|uniref:DUF759 family protein n=1 Tax=Borrelia nietonii TaxID=3117462 RepID=UPI000589F494|nr:DUF759 family protein [Borrelia nietonii]